MKKKVLITGAGSPGGPGIIKALAEDGFSVHTCDANEYASGRFLGFPFTQVPSAESPNFISSIFELCQRHHIGVVLPLVTSELCKFSEASERFLEKGIKVIVSDYESLLIANDKGKLYRHLQANNIAISSFHIVNTVEELVAAAKKLNYPFEPVCIKPTISNGSRGVRILQEDISQSDLLFNYKPNHLFTTLDAICHLLDGKQFPSLLVCEYLPGSEFTIDTIIDKGISKLVMPRSREATNSGISVRGRFEKNEEIIAYCQQIISSLHLHGPIGLQVKQDKNGAYRLLEINPRLQGTSVAALGAGINLPAIAVKQEFEPLTINEADIKWGTSFVRYYQELFY